MSFEPDLHLGNLHLLVHRPATHPDTGPGNGGRPGPCNDDQPTVAFKACGCLNGDLCTHPCDTTRDRIELAYAPVVHWLKAAA